MPRPSGSSSGAAGAKRLLLVNKYYPPKIGGVESVVAQHAHIFRRAGWDVEVLCCHHRRALRTQREDDGGVRVTRCATLGILASMPISVVFPFHLWAAGRRARLTLYHMPFPLGTLAALLVARRRRKALIWHCDIDRNKPFRKAIERLQARLAQQAEAIVTTSPEVAAGSRVVAGLGDKLRTVPLSVPHPDTPDPSPPERPPEIADSEQGYALFLGRLSYYKGLRWLMAALDVLHDRGEPHRTLIVGEGPEQAVVEAHLAQRPALDVQLVTRHVTEAEKRWLLGRAGFLLFPSVGEAEAFGIMQLEAMRKAVPVVNSTLGTGVPGVSPHNETGLTAALHDVEGLAAALGRLFAEPDLRRHLGTAARARVARYYSDEAVSERLLAILGALAPTPR